MDKNLDFEMKMWAENKKYLMVVTGIDYGALYEASLLEGNVKLFDKEVVIFEENIYLTNDMTYCQVIDIAIDYVEKFLESYTVEV